LLSSQPHKHYTLKVDKPIKAIQDEGDNVAPTQLGAGVVVDCLPSRAQAVIVMIDLDSGMRVDPRVNRDLLFSHRHLCALYELRERIVESVVERGVTISNK